MFIPAPWVHDVVATLNQRHWRWFNVATTSCDQWERFGKPLILSWDFMDTTLSKCYRWIIVELYCIMYVHGVQYKASFYSIIYHYNAEILFYKPLRPKGCFQFEIVINVLVSSFRYIWIPVLWVYGHKKYLNSFSAGTVFRRQNLTSKDVRFWRIKTVSTLKGL